MDWGRGCDLKLGVKKEAREKKKNTKGGRKKRLKNAKGSRPTGELLNHTIAERRKGFARGKSQTLEPHLGTGGYRSDLSTQNKQ